MSDFREVGEKLSNWGRWGAEDERGTTNLITEECVTAAARTVKKGKVFDLGLPLDEFGPQLGSGGRINPVRLMTATGRDGINQPGGGTGADDWVIMPLQAATHWDGLAHWYYDDKIYNGFPSTSVTSKGALRNGIHHQGKGITGRGVMLDITLHKGVDALDIGYVITPDDLDEAVDKQGVEPGPGDILMIRTGHIKRFLSGGPTAYTGPQEPGIGIDCCEWIHARDIAAVCADNHGVEVLPCEDPEQFLPVHSVLIRDMGMTLGESWNLEELGEDCRQDGVWEFLVVAPVLKFTNGLGTPLNPLAFK